MNTSSPYSGPQSMLEKRYIDQYLKARGYRLSDLNTLPPETARRLRTEASAYASLKLAELESKARFKHSIHRE